MPTGIYDRTNIKPWNTGKTKLNDIRVEMMSKKIAQSHTGKHISKETRIKIAEANKGKLKGKHNSSKTEFTTKRLKELWKNITFRNNIIESTKGTQFKKGEEHWNWKGGEALISTQRVQELEWRQKREEILERDNYKCRKCSSRNKVNVHHIIPYRISFDDSSQNLISMCNDCHLILEDCINIGGFYYQLGR